jgi:hypothetical protein
MQRNKLIYALADAALVVTSDFQKGGTWAGAIEQLERLAFIPGLLVGRGKFQHCLCTVAQDYRRDVVVGEREGRQQLQVPALRQGCEALRERVQPGASFRAKGARDGAGEGVGQGEHVSVSLPRARPFVRRRAIE